MKLYLHPLERLTTSFKATGALAQLVEQRTENPCVPGSIPGGTTRKSEFNAHETPLNKGVFLVLINIVSL